MSVTIYGGGKSIINRVVGTTATSISTTSGTYSDTGLTATITPRSTNSKILIMIYNPWWLYSNNVQCGGNKILRNGTVIWTSDYAVRLSVNNYSNHGMPNFISFVDAPASVSALTYKLQFALTAVAGTTYGYANQWPGQYSSIQLFEITGD